MPKIISQKRFCEEALEAHNKYRQLHGVQRLELSSDLTAQALEWAEQLAEIGYLKYRNSRWYNEPIGENILRAKSLYFGGDECTDEWYKEEALYKYDENFTPSTGHFTQMVWKDTLKVGFAYAQTLDGYFYVVANYFPAGNYKNEFDMNVLKPSSFKNLAQSFFPQPLSSPNLGKKINPKKIEPRNEPRMESRMEPRMESRMEPRMESRMEPRGLNNTREVDSNRKFDRSIPITINSDDSGSVFIKEAIDAHNYYRKKHGSEPLVHNPELSSIAQNYANYLAKLGNLVHSSNKYRNEKLGENLYFSFDSRSSALSGEKPTKEWYDEISQYKYRDYQPGTGHFTQVVWKSSREIGLGIAKARDGSLFVVANYYPAGNIIGKFNENVKRPFY